MRPLPEKYRVWIEARKRFDLSHAHVQMARELGMNPKKFGGLSNHSQEPWKVPLPAFIEDCYEKRFGRRLPERIESIEQVWCRQESKRQERKARRAMDRAVG